MIETLEQLRALYPNPSDRARLKTLDRLDAHMRHFVELSPFVTLGTSSDTGGDVTPRGGDPGFVRVLDDRTLALPDWPGNNRLDSLANVFKNPAVGLLFLVPGVNESLRINGTAELVTAGDLLGLWKEERRLPILVVRVKIKEAFLHCGKALLRSKLWAASAQIPRNSMATYGRMLKDQVNVADSADEIDAQLAEAYKNHLY